MTRTINENFGVIKSFLTGMENVGLKFVKILSLNIFFCFVSVTAELWDQPFSKLNWEEKGLAYLIILNCCLCVQLLSST